MPSRNSLRGAFISLPLLAILVLSLSTLATSLKSPGIHSSFKHPRVGPADSVPSGSSSTIASSAASSIVSSSSSSFSSSSPPSSPPPSSPTHTSGGSAYCLTTVDNSLSLCVDSLTGSIVSLSPRALLNSSDFYSVNASTVLENAALLTGSQTSVLLLPDGSIQVNRSWAFSAPAPEGSGAVVVDTLSPSAGSISWSVSVAAFPGFPAWSVPVVTSVSVSTADFERLKLWAPWDRGSYNSFPGGAWVDPLQPSDVRPSGWWTGGYRLGSPRGTQYDYMTAPLVSLLAAELGGGDAGVSLALSPASWPPLDIWLWLDEATTSFRFERSHGRLDATAASPLTMQLDVVGHSGDWRDGLGWTATAHADYYEPVNAEVFVACSGLGAYSWYDNSTGLSEIAADLDSMAFAVNWDLSGRYFPYMGQFLPPVGANDTWLNDPEGTQPRANVSFGSIGAWYRSMLALNYTDLSYFNINEYGINIVLPPPESATRPVREKEEEVMRVHTGDNEDVDESKNKGSSSKNTGSSSKNKGSSSSNNNDCGMRPLQAATSIPCGKNQNPSSASSSAQLSVPSAFSQSLLKRAVGGGTCESTWQNASACLIESFLDAVVMHAWDEVSQALVSGPLYSWQNAIVVDPGVESYHAFLLEQLVRHIVYEDGFAGITIDRSDWQDLYRLDADDGLTFVPEAAAGGFGGACSSLKVSYARMAEDLRGALAVASAYRNAAPQVALPVTPAGDGLMLQNTLGNGRLDQFRYFDGQFSEGYAVNGVGLLGIASPAILWTYDETECCSTPQSAATFFQTMLYMGVVPMAPFPGNDHAIAWGNATVISLYARYGFLFRAIASGVWALSPRILSVVNASQATYAKANAFVTLPQMPIPREGPLQQALIIPVVLGQEATGYATLNLTGFDRAWAQEHPLVKHRRRLAASEEGGGAGRAAAASMATLYTFQVARPGDVAWSPLPSMPNMTCGGAAVGGGGCDAVVSVQLLDGAALLRITAASAAAS